jgi:uncharacterized delta-60 repeat protein
MSPIRSFLVLIFCLPAAAVAAADGALDLTWGVVNGGKVTVDFAGSYDNGAAILVQPDGTVIVAGGSGNASFAIARLKPDGSLDPAFGSGGRVTTPMGGTASAVARQSDGKLVLAGGGNGDFLLTRYMANGTLDTTFGSGGKVTTDVAGGFDRAVAVAVQPADGKIVAGGFAQVAGHYAFAAVRYMPNWSLDGTFGTGGKVTTGWTTNDIASAMVLQPDGRIVLAGRTTAGPSTLDFALVRYTSAGALDSSFGSDGIVTTDLGGSDFALAVALQADGKIVAAGYAGTPSGLPTFGLVRYDAAGTPDPGFGTGGIVRTTINGYQCNAAVVLIQPDGKILAGGNTTTANNDIDFALVRYDTAGVLDPGFGSGGKRTVDFKGINDQITGVALDATHRILAAGTTYRGAGEGDFAIARLSAAGAPDLSWWPVVGGKVTTDVSSGNDGGSAVLLQPDGKAVVVGGANNTSFAVLRYLSDGSLDPAFGTGGVVTTAMGGSASAVARQPDGRLVVAGLSNGDFGLVRYTTAGALDGTFGIGGKVVTDIAGGFDRAVSLAIQPDGKIVAAGFAQLSGNYAFAVVRYDTAGVLDSSFGTGGKVTLSRTTNDTAGGMVLQPDGKIVVVGRSRTGGTTFDFLVARFTSAGALDPSFGTGGIVVTDVNGDVDFASAVALQPDGRILVGGYSLATGGFASFGLVRYLTNGAVDASFGVGGIVRTPFFGYACSINALAVLPGGRILAAGQASDQNNNIDYAIARYDSDGSLDATFGSGGKVTTDFLFINDQAYGIAVLPNGNFLVAGTTYYGTSRGYVSIARYLSPGPVATRFHTLPLCRLVDTRGPAGPAGGPPIAAGSVRGFPIAGRCGVPAGATAVSLNVAVTAPTSTGFLTLFAGGGAPPKTTTINFRTGQTRANDAIAPLGPNGDLAVSDGQATGTVHLILDVAGYFQ